MENWQPVKGYDGIYEVSDKGRVRSLKFCKERILKPIKDPGGYLRVNLCKEGKVKLTLVHRIVAEAFIQNPNNLETVNHKDEVKTNNVVSNLEWMSKRDNNNYGTHNKRVSETQINDPNKSKEVQMFDKKTGELLETFPSINEAARVTGIKRASISHCCTGISKSAGGYIWRYS